MRKGIPLGASVALVAAAACLFLRQAPESSAPDIAPGSRPPAASPESPRDPPSGTSAGVPRLRTDAVSIVGRVVDERRFPVPGTSVTVERLGSPVLYAMTSADGRFRIEGAVRPASGTFWDACLRARAADGRAAMRTISLDDASPGAFDSGTLVVGMAHALAVRALDAGSPVPGARFALGNDAGWILEATAGADGVARFESLPGGGYAVRARAASPLRAGRVEVVLEAGLAQPVDVTLAPARTVEVLVVERSSGRPLPGATFRVRFQRSIPGRTSAMDAGPLPPVAPTDAEGRTRVEGTCPDDVLYLADARAPGFDTAGFHPVTTVQPRVTEARIEMQGPRTLRFPVTTGPGKAPIPPDGADIALRPFPGERNPAPRGPAKMEGDVLVVSGAGAGHLHALAEAPDGSFAALSAAPEDPGKPPPGPVSFQVPCRVEVLARRPDGVPAEGSAFVIRNVNPVTAIGATDAAGRIAFSVPSQVATADLFLLPNASSPWGGRLVEKLNISKGDVQVEVVVRPRRTFLARVTVDGERRLPPRLHVSVNGIGILQPAEDPAKGEIRFEYPPDPKDLTVEVSLFSHPYLTVPAVLDALPPEGTVEVDLALRSPGALSVPVRPPTDGPCRLCVQRWAPSRGAWEAAEGTEFGFMGSGEARLGPDGTVRAEPLHQGRYRIVDAATGMASEPVEIRPGEQASAGAMDLSRSGWVQGRVVGPDGADLSRAGVVLLGEGLVPVSELPQTEWVFGPDRGPQQAAGAFKVRVPGDRPVTLLPTHPLLVPAAEAGTAVVTGPQEGLVLRLEPGTLATMRLDTEPKLPFWGPHGERVLLFRGEPVGEPAEERPAVLEGDRLAFGGFAPGTWTLLVDFPVDGPEGFAPAILPGVALGEGTTDLGTVRLERGSRLRFRVLVKERADVPQVNLSATRVDPPRYTRAVQSYGAREFTLGGLGPGRFRIRGTGIDEVREVDGVNDEEIVLDLR